MKVAPYKVVYASEGDWYKHILNQEIICIVEDTPQYWLQMPLALQSDKVKRIVRGTNGYSEEESFFLHLDLRFEDLLSLGKDNKSLNELLESLDIELRWNT